MHAVREALDRPGCSTSTPAQAAVWPPGSAEIGYNRASRCARATCCTPSWWHCAWCSRQVSSGKQHSSACQGCAGRCSRLATSARAAARTATQRRHLVELEAAPAYLLSCARRQRAAPVPQFARADWSRPDNQGCQMVEDQLQLHGWSKKRRVVIVRQRIKGGIARERRIDNSASSSWNCSQRARGRSAVGVRGAGDRRELPDRGHRAALPRPADAENVRRVEEPVGPERLHDAGHQPLPDHGAGLCAGLQLVELVLPGRASGRAHGSHHQPALLLAR